MKYFITLKLQGNTKLLVFALTWVMLAFHFSPINAQFDGGDGSEGNPYQISSSEQLDSVRYYLDSHFRINNDIDLSFETGESEGKFYPRYEAPAS